MIRSDHVAGGVLIAAALLVFALSGDLPFGSLAFPGAGFMPKVLAATMAAMGALLALGGARSPSFRELGWDDLKHAILVLVITSAAIAGYDRLGFIVALPLMIFALLVIIERKKILPAALYSATVTLLAYTVFVVLRAPVPVSPFGY